MNSKFKVLFPMAAAFALMVTGCGEESSKDNQIVQPMFDASSSSVDPFAIPASSSSADLLVASSSSAATAAVVIPPTVGVGLLLDDLEDGDNETNVATYWYTYDDASNDAASVITTPVDEAGYIIPGLADNGSNYAMVVNYTLNKGEYKYDPYVGWGFEIDVDDANARFGGITYWYKGGAHEVHIETTDIEDYDVHLAKIKASRTWTQAVVRFKDLIQGFW